jgi:hypothetical protein
VNLIKDGLWNHEGNFGNLIFNNEIFVIDQLTTIIKNENNLENYQKNVVRMLDENNLECLSSLSKCFKKVTQIELKRDHLLLIKTSLNHQLLQFSENIDWFKKMMWDQKNKIKIMFGEEIQKFDELKEYKDEEIDFIISNISMIRN